MKLVGQASGLPVQLFHWSAVEETQVSQRHTQQNAYLLRFSSPAAPDTVLLENSGAHPTNTRGMA